MAKRKAKVIEEVVEVQIETSEERKAKAVPIELTKAQVGSLEGFATVSAKIRYLASLEFNTAQIAAYLGTRYQHVRNVLTTPLKRGAAESK